MGFGLQIVDRIRGALAQLTADGEPVSASFGLAQLGPGESYEALFARADQALLQVKREGRGGVYLTQVAPAAPDQPPPDATHRR